MSPRGRRPTVRHEYVDAPHPADYAAQGEYGVHDGAPDEWYEKAPRRRRRIITPARFLLVLVLIGAAAVAVYGIFFDRTRLQIPLTVSGLAVFGAGLAILALMSARGAARLGRSGSGGRAMLAALFGGLCAFGAAGSLAGAVVLGILSATV